MFAINDRRVEDGTYDPKLVAVKYPVTDPVVTGSTQLSFDAIDNRPSNPVESQEAGKPVLFTTTAKKGEKIKINLSPMGATIIVNVEYRVESTEPGGDTLEFPQGSQISTDQILTLTLPQDAKPGTYKCYIDIGKGERQTEALLTVKE